MKFQTLKNALGENGSLAAVRGRALNVSHDSDGPLEALSIALAPLLQTDLYVAFPSLPRAREDLSIHKISSRRFSLSFYFFRDRREPSGPFLVESSCKKTSGPSYCKSVIRHPEYGLDVKVFGLCIRRNDEFMRILDSEVKAGFFRMGGSGLAYAATVEFSRQKARDVPTHEGASGKWCPLASREAAV